MKEISTQELVTRLKADPKPFLLDVRQPDEYANGHIDGAVLIPLGDLERRVGELDPKRETVVNCQGGGRSSRAVQLLEAYGFADVSNLAGGYGAWKML